MRSSHRLFSVLVFAGGLAACGGDGTGPADGGLSVAVQTGDAQFGTTNAQLAEPLQVVVADPVSKKPKSGVQVSWSVVEGIGATLTSLSSVTDLKGVASTQLKLGETLGTYRVEATIPKIVGQPARFSARAVETPNIVSVTPTSANAGDTVTIVGQNFSPTADENIVLFGGFRGKVTSASGTQLRAVIPLCIPSRTVAVRTSLGAVASNSINISVLGTTASALQLSRGEVRTFSDPNELACFQLPGGVSGLTLLLVPQNYSQVVSSIATMEVAGLSGGLTASAPVTELLAAPLEIGLDWELRLRKRERELLQSPAAALRPQFSITAASCGAQTLGARCDFQVINKEEKFTRVTAEVKAVTTHAIVYQDITAPVANGLTTSDFQGLGSVFDDPIYSADVATFGSPSDLDANGKIIILMTPVVNALTDRGSSGFIGGFFYGCDLLSRTACTGSNGAEIFYTLTADPTGQYSDTRTRDLVMRSLPPVLAHEFQHMINWGERGNSTDALWLSEGMAHHAEDVVGDVFESRGDLTNATLFKQQNYVRGNRFLRATASTSLLSEEEIGSLELRGAAWLFVKYLAGQFGNQILAKLTRSTLSSVANVTAQTGKPWATLMSDWSVALWADDAPELAGVTVRTENTFPNINLRQKLGNSNGSYPLTPSVFNFQDFVFRSTLPASSEAYVLLQAGTNPQALNLSFSGQYGGAFAQNAAPQMTIMRVK